MAVASPEYKLFSTKHYLIGNNFVNLIGKKRTIYYRGMHE